MRIVALWPFAAILSLSHANLILHLYQQLPTCTPNLCRSIDSLLGNKDLAGVQQIAKVMEGIMEVQYRWSSLPLHSFFPIFQRFDCKRIPKDVGAKDKFEMVMEMVTTAIAEVMATTPADKLLIIAEIVSDLFLAVVDVFKFDINTTKEQKDAFQEYWKQAHQDIRSILLYAYFDRLTRVSELEEGMVARSRLLARAPCAATELPVELMNKESMRICNLTRSVNSKSKSLVKTVKSVSNVIHVYDCDSRTRQLCWSVVFGCRHQAELWQFAPEITSLLTHHNLQDLVSLDKWITDSVMNPEQLRVFGVPPVLFQVLANHRKFPENAIWPCLHRLYKLDLIILAIATHRGALKKFVERKLVLHAEILALWETFGKWTERMCHHWLQVCQSKAIDNLMLEPVNHLRQIISGIVENGYDHADSAAMKRFQTLSKYGQESLLMFKAFGLAAQIG